MRYIITFYAHIGAIRYRKECLEKGIEATIMPVPRALSSSCGSCVQTLGGYLEPVGEMAEEVEQIVAIQGEGYQVMLDLR